MQSEHPNTVSRNPRIATGNHKADLRTSQHTKPDTRRFAGIFPLEVPEAVSVDCDDATHEEHNNDFDDPSRWEFIVAPDKNTSTTQITSTASTDESSTLSAAQQVIACYRAVHDSDHPECAMTEAKEKGLPQIPDDQRSMYTLATPADTQSTMDMMWRPKPKVHMRRTDQRALIHAQGQAIAMMHSAGLKPTNKIQCRRRGCADILSGVEALKYHLHIHNIADMAAKCDDTSAACKDSLVECSTSNSKTSKSSHCRSKSSLGTQHGCFTTRSSPRKLSAGSLFPPLFSSRETTPEPQHVPNLMTVAKAFVSDPSPSRSAGPIPVHNGNETFSAHASTPSRGRRTRKESMAASVGAGFGPSIAMLLSAPSSPDIHGGLVLTPHTNSPMSLALKPATDDKNDNRVFIPDENSHSVSEKLTRSRSPMRALSPTRAMSPIRSEDTF
ncbi:hypothetical protein J3R83DRAFT_12214 [Lanmaoa asiatica]|nr:hypothetical protein J3R83DRAFT_12214 [Lanmaoa asiatica]